MADYRRVVSYMYNYENGEKRNNIGFARIEGRSDQCKITINIKALSINQGNLKTYIFHRDDRDVEYIYLGEVVIKNGIGDMRTDTDMSNIMNSGYNFDQMGGIVIYSSDSKFFATEWDDRPILVKDLAGINGKKKTMATSDSKSGKNKAEIVEELVEDIQKEINNDIVRNIFVNGEVHDERSEQSESQPNEKFDSTGRTGTSKEDGNGQYTNHADESVSWTDAEPIQNDYDESNAGTNQEYVNEPNAESSQEYANGRISKPDQIDDRSTSERYEHPTEYAKRERKKGYGNLRVVSPIHENNQEEYTVEAARKSDDSKTGFCNNQKAWDDPLNFNFYRFYAPFQDASVMETESVQNNQIQQENSPDNIIIESLENNDEVGKSEKNDSSISTQDVRKMDKIHPLANRIFERFPRMKPFNDDNITECVKIEPQDIGMFPMENWILGNNSFLLHGYYNYRHLIFAKQEVDNDIKYILGVPGVYQNREFFLAKMFGFDNFKPVMQKEEQNGEFGYWYINVMI